MNKAANAIAAESLEKDKVIQLYTKHWNTVGILRHQWLAVPSMIGPVTPTPKRNYECNNPMRHFAQLHSI